MSYMTLQMPLQSGSSRQAQGQQVALAKARPQEVVVQNFLPKLQTRMKGVRACPSDDYLWTLAAARLILPPDVHLQAPPNLSDDFGSLLDAGIDDCLGLGASYKFLLVRFLALALLGGAHLLRFAGPPICG